MIQKGSVTLIYVKEYVANNKSPKKDDIERVVKCDVIGKFSSNYYVQRDRDMLVSNTLRVGKHYINDYQEGQLRYVDFQGKRYSIKNILNDDANRRNRYVLLDVEEYKR